MKLSIIIDTYPMNPKNPNFCWRISDSDNNTVHAYGFEKTLGKCFEEAHLNLLKTEEFLKSKKSVIWKEGDFFEEKEEDF